MWHTTQQKEEDQMQSGYEEVLRKQAEVCQETLGKIEQEIAERRAIVDAATQAAKELDMLEQARAEATRMAKATAKLAAAYGISRPRVARARNKPVRTARAAGKLSPERKAKAFEK